MSEAVETGYAVLLEGDDLPYLPDPLATTIAARIFDLPGFSSDKIIPIPLYADGAEWPNALPFKIELLEDPNEKPHFDATKRTLFIPLGKAERATLRLSCRMNNLRQTFLNLFSSWCSNRMLDMIALDGSRTKDFKEHIIS